MSHPSALLIFCDAFLAGIYGRKLERDGWDVDVEETVVAGELRAAKNRHSVVVVDVDCLVDPVEEVRRLRTLPTMLHAKIVLFATSLSRDMIELTKQAGADAYLLKGHFVPREAVEKLRRLIQNYE